MFDHRIDNCQQFAHASDERKLWRLSCIAQPLVESSNDSIMSAVNQSCHVERCTYGGPTAPDRATPSKFTAVMVEWRDADQRCDLFTIELPEFRQFSQQRTANNRTDPRHASKQFFGLLPDGASTDALIEIFVGTPKLCFQPADVSIDTVF